MNTDPRGKLTNQPQHESSLVPTPWRENEQDSLSSDDDGNDIPPVAPPRPDYTKSVSFKRQIGKKIKIYDCHTVCCKIKQWF